MTWNNRPFRFSIGRGGGYYNPWHRPSCCGWYGPGGYRPPSYRPYPPPGYSKPRPTPYGTSAGIGPGQLPAGVQPGVRPSRNIYERPTIRDKVVNRPSTRDRVRPAQFDSPNNLLTDRSGNVYRPRQGGGWETHENGKWKPGRALDWPSTSSTRPSTPSQRPLTPGTRPSVRPAPSTRPSTGRATRPQLERDYRSRQWGSQRIRQRPTRPRTVPRARPRR